MYEMTREEEFIASRSRHPMRIRMKTGIKNDGTMTANEMYALSDTGAYGCHALTVTGHTGQKSMGLYVGDGEYRKKQISVSMRILFIQTPYAVAVMACLRLLPRPSFEHIARSIGMIQPNFA